MSDSGWIQWLGHDGWCWREYYSVLYAWHPIDGLYSLVAGQWQEVTQ